MSWALPKWYSRQNEPYGWAVVISPSACGARSDGASRDQVHLRGLRTAAHRINPGTRATGEALLQAAESQICDLLVLGGYGHNSVREFVFSGVTLHVLRNRARFAVLFAY